MQIPVPSWVEKKHRIGTVWSRAWRTNTRGRRGLELAWLGRHGAHFAMVVNCQRGLPCRWWWEVLLTRPSQWPDVCQGTAGTAPHVVMNSQPPAPSPRPAIFQTQAGHVGRWWPDALSMQCVRRCCEYSFWCIGIPSDMLRDHWLRSGPAVWWLRMAGLMAAAENMSDDGVASVFNRTGGHSELCLTLGGK